jgi:hypothetical protein
MRDLIQSVKLNLSQMGYHPEVIMDYLKSFLEEFGKK